MITLRQNLINNRWDLIISIPDVSFITCGIFQQKIIIWIFVLFKKIILGTHYYKPGENKLLLSQVVPDMSLSGDF